MTDYKRMVSYMYQYENGMKKKNVGFARVEAKGGQCKITLHMQLLGQLDSIFPVYLLQRDDNSLELVYLGDAVLKNQVMDSRLSADENNIMNSGHGLSDMNGILLFLNDKVFFATVWDDGPVVAEEVLEALRPKKHRQEAKREEAVVKGTKPDVQKEQEALSLHKSVDKMEGGQDRASQTLNLPNYMLPGGWKMMERLQWSLGVTEQAVKEQAEVTQETELQTTDEPKAENEIMASPEAEDETMVSPKAEEHTIGNIWTVVNQDNNLNADSLSYGGFTEGMDQETQDQIYKIIEELNAAQYNGEPGVTVNQTGSIYQADPPAAKHFFDHYPRIYPFEDSEITHCVKIEPKDIGLFPKEMWPYSNNSFLMHGYYCYHHLIFARMKNGYGYHYILGIPGIYHGREQFMARMFGFESFKSIKKREPKQGDFGYWYLPVTL